MASAAGSVDSATGCSLSVFSVGIVAIVVAATADVVGSSELAEPNRIIQEFFKIRLREDLQHCVSLPGQLQGR